MAMTKKEFRTKMRKILALIPLSVIQRDSASITSQILANPAFISAKSVSIFLSMPTGEVQTNELVKAILNLKKELFVPLCTNEQMKMMRIKDLADLLSLKPNAWGIPEPSPSDGRLSSDENGLDLVLMPGVAFDKNGDRIGYGKGYYDTFLSKCFLQADEARRVRPRVIALALTAQAVEIVPTESTDIKPDWICYPLL